MPLPAKPDKEATSVVGLTVAFDVCASQMEAALNELKTTCAQHHWQCVSHSWTSVCAVVNRQG